MEHHPQTAESAASALPATGKAAAYSAFNAPGAYDAYVRLHEDQTAEADLIVNGIHCAGCVSTIERGLHKAGLIDVRVNLGNHRAHVRWDERRMRLADVLATLQDLGYGGYPYDPETQETQARAEWRRAIARLGVAGFGAGNVMLLSVALYAGHFYGIEESFRTLFQWISAAIALPVVAYSGGPFFTGAWAGLRRGTFTMDSLIALGIAVTGAFSVVGLFNPGQETYFDSVVMITFFLLVGRTLETMARHRTGGVTERLMGLQVKWATRLNADGTPGEQVVPVNELAPGDRLVVRAGESLPTDGEVLEGESDIDESAMTGEPQPRAVAPGDAVLGGTVNSGQTLVIRAARVGAETVLARICRLVEEAQTAKAPIQRLADWVAARFVATILVLSAGTFGVWQWVLPEWSHQPAWITAIAVLIIACPCALGLATPVAVLAGSARAAGHGVLVKGGAVLERAAHVTDVVLDKTGTLTTGHMTVSTAQTLGTVPMDGWLGLAAAVERRALHPLATAIVAYAEAGDTEAIAAAMDVQVRPGRGALGRVGATQVAVGNARLLTELGIAAPEEPPDGPGTLVYVAVDGALAGRLTLTDPLRPDAAEAVRALQAMGTRVHLLSGDRPGAVAAVAREAGITQAQGGMLPDAKLLHIRELQEGGAVVAMVGDGLNDAPALTQADLGIAVSTASDLALESADVILMQERLGGMVETLTTARHTLRAIKQNLGLSVGYNVIAVPLAMSGYVIPLVAALFMAASSLLVVGNALRLRFTGLGGG